MNDPQCMAKFNRAFEHYETIEQVVREWTGKYRFTHDDAGDSSGAKIVRLHAPPAPEKLGLLIGECLNNARSFLDNLAFHLAIAYSGAGFTEVMQKGSEFPIFCERRPSETEIGKRIGGVAPGARAAIEELQPCNRPNWREDWLGRLHDLDRVNKHRFILASAAVNIQPFAELLAGLSGSEADAVPMAG